MPVMPCCCGSSPLDCGCARRLTLSFTSLAVPTDPINLNADGSVTAIMPAFAATTYSITIPKPGPDGPCYFLGAANAMFTGPAVVTGASPSTFDLYLLVYWDDAGGTSNINILIVGLQTGATWDRIAIIAAFVFGGGTCCSFNSGFGDDNTDNTQTEPNDERTDITLLPAMVSDGLFTSTTPTFVTATKVADPPINVVGHIACCPLCFSVAQPDAVVTTSDGVGDGSYAQYTSSDSADGTEDLLDCIIGWRILPSGSRLLVESIGPEPNAGPYDVNLLDLALSATGVELDCVDGVLTGTATLTSSSGPPRTAMVTFG